MQTLLVLLLILLSLVIWFVFTANAVRFATNVEEYDLEIQHWLAFDTGVSWLVREGTYDIQAIAAGYQPLEHRLVVSNEADQTVQLTFLPLPGVINFKSTPDNAEISEGNELLGRTPLTVELAAGPHEITFEAARYINNVQKIEVEGRGIEQEVTVSLEPNWSTVTLPTNPSGAEVLIDHVPTEFRTPGPIEVLRGEHLLTVTSPGYKSWSDIVNSTPGTSVRLDHVDLELIGGAVVVNSTPSGATVTTDGRFLGTTPFSVNLETGTHVLTFLKQPFHTESRTVSVLSATRSMVQVNLRPLTGVLVVETRPEGAQIWIDGKFRENANATLNLPVGNHLVELKKTGYAGFSEEVNIASDFARQVKVELLTHEEARRRALEGVTQTIAGQELVLLQPDDIQMGASRRQPGRRANENLRTAIFDRLFYMTAHEVTNAEFRQFANGHDSGDYENIDLDADKLPVVRVSWKEAIQYCNWLSEQEGLEPFYTLQRTGDIEVKPSSVGYRLPTEAEWSWAARKTGNGELLHYPWGDGLPPPQAHGNYADRAAQHVVGRIIYNYNDNHIGPAPIGSFEANHHGLFDMGGNVAEWVHDFYAIPKTGDEVPVLGPSSGEYHVIRGSSWAHGTIVDLRLTYRNYGTEGSHDLGFRVARFAE